MGEKIKSRFEEDSISLPAGSVYMIRHNMAPLNGKVSLHYHDHYEAFFAVSGDILYNVEGYTYRMEPGHLLLIPPYRLHQPCIHSGHCSERIALRFSQELPEKLNGKDHNIQWSGTENIPVQQYCLEEPQCQEMKTLLQKLLCEDKGNAYGKETVIHALLTCFFCFAGPGKITAGKSQTRKNRNDRNGPGNGRIHRKELQKPGNQPPAGKTIPKKLQPAVKRIQRRSRRLPVSVSAPEKTPECRKTPERRNPAPHSRRRKRLLRLQQLLPPIPHHVRLRPERILQKILIFFRLDKIRKHAYDKDNLNK